MPRLQRKPSRATTAALTAAIQPAIQPLEPRTLFAVSGVKVPLGDTIGTNYTEARTDAMYPVGDHLLFIPIVNNRPELWSTDGTPENTFPIAQTVPGDFFNFVDPLGTLNGYLYYFYSDAGGPRSGLYRTDGTPAGTSLIKPSVDPITGIGMYAELGNAPSPNTVIMNGELYFISQIYDPAFPDRAAFRRLFKTDGTAEGTVQLTNSTAVNTPISNLVALDNRVIFSAYIDNIGFQFWSSDGTPEGTAPYTLPAGAESNFTTTDRPALQKLKNAAVYVSDNHLWRTDGTTAGTYQVSDFYVGVSNLANDIHYDLATLFVAGDYVYFNGGINDNNRVGAVCRSDGTTSGTTLLKDLDTVSNANRARDFVQIGNLTYFSAFTSSLKQELFVTDGTPAGTKLAVDVEPSSQTTYGLVPQHLTQGPDGKLWFDALGSNGNAKLYTSDGTPTGTYLFSDLTIGDLVTSQFPWGKPTFFNGKAFFSLDDDYSSTPRGLYYIPLDSIAPTASLTQPIPNLITPNQTGFDITVNYRDPDGIDLSSISGDNLYIDRASSFGSILKGVLLSTTAIPFGYAATYRITHKFLPTFNTTENGAYAIKILTIPPKDIKGNSLLPTTLGTFTVAIDQTAPAVSPVTITPPGPTAHTFDVTVNYTDTNGITPSSLAATNLLLSGPDSLSLTPTLLSTISLSGGASATYRFTAPGSGNSTFPEGRYTLTLAASQVTDLAGNFASTAALGSFTLNSTTPLATLEPITPPAKNAPSLPIIIRYTDALGFSIATFNTGDLRVTGPNNFTANPTFVSATPITGGYEVLYSLAAPTGAFTTPTNGVYSIGVVANQIADTTGQLAPPALLGTFTVAVDSLAPTVTLPPAPTINRASTSLTYSIRVFDETALLESSFSSATITLTDPASNLFATLPFTTATSITGGFELTFTADLSLSTAPAGTYTVAFLPGSLSDTSGNSPLSRTLPTFTLNDLPTDPTSPPPPTVSPHVSPAAHLSPSPHQPPTTPPPPTSPHPPPTPPSPTSPSPNPPPTSPPAPSSP